MRKRYLVLVVTALTGWCVALTAQVLAMATSDVEKKARWKDRRNLCFLLSSLAMNTLALSLLFQFGKALRSRVRGEGQGR